jgi:hypothetical protein
MKSRRQALHVARMGEKRNAYSGLLGIEGKRILGKP